MEFFKQEDLHKDLARYITNVNGIGKCLKHPLVFSIPYDKIMNSYLNKIYKYKLELLKGPVKYTNIFLYERPFRWTTLYSMKEKLDTTSYWTAFKDVWVDSENISECIDTIKKLMVYKKHGKIAKKILIDKSIDNISGEKIVIYRGSQNNELGHGFSWSIDKEKALWFANRFSRNGKLFTGEVLKKDIFAYILDRGESEIIVDYRKVMIHT